MNRDNILGCLLGGTMGDAMRAVAEVRTMEQIKGQFSGYARKFFTSPGDTFTHDCKQGQIADDFSIAYINCVGIVSNHGIIDEETAKRALLKWCEVPEFKRFAEPTMKTAVQVLAGETPVDTGQETFIPAVNNGKRTNGAAMKAAPTALLDEDDVEPAIRNTVKLCGVTHNNNIALSGTCAITTAMAQALHEGTTLSEIINAGMCKTAQGDQLGRASGKTVCGPSIEKRIKKAAELGTLTKGMEGALTLIGDCIGSGLMVAETVPAVFGPITASKGDLLEALFAGVSIGDDTDTVAMMIGGIMGAHRGVSSFPGEYLTVIKEDNRIDVEGLAKQVEESWKGEQEHT